MNLDRISIRISISTAIFAAFLILKLSGAVSWSWWIVTAPLWAPWAVLAALCVIGLLLLGVVGSVAAALAGIETLKSMSRK